MAGVTFARGAPIVAFRQFATCRTHEYILGVSSVFREKITGEKIDVLRAIRALLNFDPQKVLYVSIRRSTAEASGPIEVPQLTLEF